MWISFAWTTDTLLAGLKIVTRRDWTDGHASKFHKGDYTDAWNKNPRCKGAKKAAIIYHTADPYRQWLHDVTDEDEIKEGHLWGSGIAFREAMGIDRPLYVVEFKLVSVITNPQESNQPALF